MILDIIYTIMTNLRTALPSWTCIVFPMPHVRQTRTKREAIRLTLVSTDCGSDHSGVSSSGDLVAVLRVYASTETKICKTIKDRKRGDRMLNVCCVEEFATGFYGA